MVLLSRSSSPTLVARAAAYGVARVVAKPPPEADVFEFVSAHCLAPVRCGVVDGGIRGWLAG